jgi:serine/threonine protein kinase
VDNSSQQQNDVSQSSGAADGGLYSGMFKKAIQTCNMLEAYFDDIQHISDGSRGNVFTATRIGDSEDKLVVLKVIKEEAFDNKFKLREFTSECALLSAFAHAHIVHVLGSGSFQVHAHGPARQLLVVEYLTGGTLADALRNVNFSRSGQWTQGPFPAPALLRLLREFLCALVYLQHEYDPDAVVVHRDLKPGACAACGAGRVHDMHHHHHHHHHHHPLQ